MASICDFCNQPDPCWRYAVTDFVVPQAEWGSGGGAYLACQQCHELISRNDEDGLLARMVTHYLEANAPPDGLMEMTVDSFRFALNAFYTYRQPVPAERL